VSTGADGGSMFAQTFVDTQSSRNKPWTMAASLGIQSVALGTLLIIPLMHPEMLHPKFETPLWIPIRLKPEPPRPVAPKGGAVAPTATPHVFTAPSSIPSKVAKIVEAMPDAPETTGIYIPGASAIGIAGMPTGAVSVALPDKPPAAKPPNPVQTKAADGPMRVGGSVQASRLLFGPKPPYPPIAKAARVQGTVKLQAVIAPDGRIRGLQAVAGPALLIKAAMDAVAQWRYAPTLLNGEPVEVLTEIDVNFTLN